MRLGTLPKTRALARFVAPAALALTVATAATACGLGDKTRQAERIQRAVAAIGDDDVAAEFTYALTSDDAPFAALTPTSAVADDRLRDLLRAAATLTIRAELEPGKRRAEITVGDDAAPAAIFRDNEVFVRRLNARDTERRVWARYDIEDLGWRRSAGLDDLEAPALSRAMAVVINPVFFVELATGALAGSVRAVGRAPIGGDETTHYRFNLSFDKAMKALGFGDEERLTRYGIFRQFGITKDVVPGQAWVDGAGRVRKVVVTVPVAVDPVRTHELTVTALLAPAAGNVHITRPAPEATVTYEALARLVRAGLPEETPP